jgi:hypothetical protein
MTFTIDPPKEIRDLFPDHQFQPATKTDHDDDSESNQ